ncbi:MAG TPA: hypothetical protein VIT22_00360 [Pseudoxanthomonas sp.]
MILTFSVLVYQLFFVLLLYVASRIGPKVLLVALVCCLLWTATHIFFPPLAIVQTAVIVISYFAFRKRWRQSAAIQIPKAESLPSALSDHKDRAD